MNRKLDKKKIAFGVCGLLLLGIFVFSAKNTVVLIGRYQGYISVVSILSVIIGCAMLAVVFYMALSRKWTLYKLYPIIAGGLGILYIMIMPVFSAPDEKSHFDSAYVVSNQMMGVEETKDPSTFYKRACDSVYFESRLYNQLYEQFQATFISDPETELVEVRYEGRGKGLASIVPALGITLGRILKLNFPVVAILGMAFSLAFFILGMTYALRILPLGQNALFVIALLPITLQEARSYSYDAPLLLSAALVVALTLHWKKEDRVVWYEVLLYVLASFMLVYLKPGVYTVLILFPVFVFVRREWLKKYAVAFVIGLVLMIVAAVMVLRSAYVTDLLAREAYVPWCNEFAYSADYYLKNPGALLQTYGNTIRQMGVVYVAQMLGSFMGWLEIMGSMRLVKILAVLALLSLLRREDETMRLQGYQRVVLVCMGILGMFLSSLAMLLLWTPQSSHIIEGVQGRYFLPVMLPLALGIGMWKVLVVKKESQGYLAVAMSITSYFVILHVLRCMVASRL